MNDDPLPSDLAALDKLGNPFPIKARKPKKRSPMMRCPFSGEPVSFETWQRREIQRILDKDD